MQPVSQRLNRRGLFLKLFCELRELLYFVPIDRLEQSFARGEVSVERSDSDSGALRHRFEACVGPSSAENRLRRIQYALAIANRIGTRPAGRFNQWCLHISVPPVVQTEPTSSCLLTKRRVPPYILSNRRLPPFVTEGMPNCLSNSQARSPSERFQDSTTPAKTSGSYRKVELQTPTA